MEGSEKRKFRRMGAKFDISCVQVDSLKAKFQAGYTVNLCPGGLYFKTDSSTCKTGDLLKVNLMIPPTHGLLEFGGKISGYAKVMRTEDIDGSDGYGNEPSQRYGVAVEFCRPLRVCM